MHFFVTSMTTHQFVIDRMPMLVLVVHYDDDNMATPPPYQLAQLQVPPYATDPRTGCQVRGRATLHAG